MVKDDKKNDQDDLIEELSPALHQEGTRHLSSTVKAIFTGTYFAGAHSILHAGCRSHRVFATDANPVEEQTPSVKDNPPVLGRCPRSSKHEKSNEHDDSILNETPPSTQPILTLIVELHEVQDGSLTNPQ